MAEQVERRTGYLSYYQHNLERRLMTEGACVGVTIGTMDKGGLAPLFSFLKESEVRTLVTINLESLGLQVVQWSKAKQWLQEKEIECVFLETSGLPQAEYLQVLDDLGRQEKRMIRRRTLVGLDEANKQGRKGGRPGISENTIQKIRDLSFTHKKGQRDIASLCGVSIGTVNKYINLPYVTEQLAKKS